MEIINKSKSSVSFVAMAMFVAVNSLLLLKYAVRLGGVMIPMTATAIYVIAAIICFKYIFKKIDSLSVGKGKVLVVVVTLALVGVALVPQYVIDPYSIKVDRWSAIHFWCYNLVHGEYPYLAQTHLGGYGSPFPVWQVFHLPFYALGNVGLSFVVAAVWLVYAVSRYHGTSTALKVALMMWISPAWWYEVAVRSDLISNIMILAGVIVWLYATKRTLQHNFWLVVILTGLFMSTRLLTLLPLAVLYFRQWLGLTTWRKILFPIGVLAVFAITFLPFVLWNGNMLLFFEYNPFILQSRQGFLSDFLILIPLGILAAMMWNGDYARYNLYTGALIVVFIAVTFLHRSILSEDFNYFSPLWDITYFSTSLPFFMIAAAGESQSSIYNHESNKKS